MKSWWKRFSDALGSENETDEEKIIKHDYKEKGDRSRPEVHVRTRTVYPKNQSAASPFRFPVIPDEVVRAAAANASQQVRRNPRQRVQDEINKSVRKEHVPANNHSTLNNARRNAQQGPNTKENTENKKPAFKPTAIVSPIYGTVRTDQNKMRSLDSFVHTGISSRNEEANPLSKRFEETETKQPVVLEAIIEPANVTPTIEKPNQALNITEGDLIEIETDLTYEKPDNTESIQNTVEASETIETISVVDEPVTHTIEKLYSSPTESAVSTRSVAPSVSSASSIEESYVKESPTVPVSPPVPATPSIPSYLQVNRAQLAATSEVSTDTPISTPGVFYSSTGVKTPAVPVASDSSFYKMPSLHLLNKEPILQGQSDEHTEEQIEKLTVALENFHVNADVIGVVKGPTVTRYELQPAPGVKVNKFTNLIDDIKLALAAKDIRMEAPIPGRSAIGIEVPNEIAAPVFIRSIIESEEFRSHPSPLAVALGRDIGGEPIIGDLKKMPHGLIAGSTGSGKSVCINSILVSLLYKAKPSEVRLILVDPKVVELAPYNHIPHLLTPVVTDPKQATAALRWAVEEMDARYEKFADKGARDIERYNHNAVQEGLEKLPYIVIIIDELADLMMVAPGDVEEAICRIAQKARACGIHLLVATQRPSVDVITGLIKANIPSRVAFAVSSGADSRTILDMGGAERLLGKGDMLYYPSGLAKPIRLQGNFVSDDEIEAVVDHVKKQQKVQYLFDKEELTRAVQSSGENEDEIFEDALLFVVEQGQASASSLQRRFRIGYNRAARLIDMMESEGFIAGQSGSKPREVLISEEDFRNMIG
ncbi:DNA translocase FtsK [Ammoniphilus sp. 3BR4]|uniref:DNA translocase FtsK n=1 Tax=Ammoniphilus sp. 3BR4 TaxID=3158265 RepID=UPI003467DEB4